MVAHECIIDFRDFKEKYGVMVDDVAKRLVDYGFHAPTISFPVPETMMIEPTESEDKKEIDRFCDAMISIFQEIVEEPDIVRNAPHVPALLMDEWEYEYSKKRAFYPMEGMEDKYWPPVGKIDNVYGDRNLRCCQ
jgi:glycine dehydrogenase